MVALLLERAKHRGYILFESLLALGVVFLVFLMLMPLTVFIETKRNQNRHKLEVYRYFSELAGGYQHQGTLTFPPKELNDLTITAAGKRTVEGGIREIYLELEGERFEIIWLWEQEN